jgi:hypothetical protein
MLGPSIIELFSGHKIFMVRTGDLMIVVVAGGGLVNYFLRGLYNLFNDGRFGEGAFRLCFVGIMGGVSAASSIIFK